MYGLSLEQAPPYRIPLFFYLIGVSYLLVFSIFALTQAFGISSRFEPQVIAMTHLFTLGFFTHVMFGTLFQMVPVIIGEAYHGVESGAKATLFFLNLGTFSLVGYFLTQNSYAAFGSFLFLGFGILFFTFYSIVTIMRTKEKNAVVRTFLAALLFLGLGTILGMYMLLEHTGAVQGQWLGDVHIEVMLFGWVFLLFVAVSYKVLPMFYVAKEYPLFVKNYLFLVVFFLLLGIFISTMNGAETLLMIFKLLLSLVLAVYSILTMVILKKRKRARSDITVKFFYFANANLFAGSVAWAFCMIFDLQGTFVFALFFGLGFIYGLINGMLYKIIPFLTWFHLSSKFVIEAEMIEVIPLNKMRFQAYIFFVSYVLFALSLWSKIVIYGALILFFFSSAFLLYNIARGYIYHQKMVKKAVVL